MKTQGQRQFLWKSETWPPTALAGETSVQNPGYTITGTILQDFPLRVRNSRVMTGYMSQTTGNEKEIGHHVLLVDVNTIQLSSPLSVSTDVCGSCGVKSSGSKFCAECGAKVDNQETKQDGNVSVTAFYNQSCNFFREAVGDMSGKGEFLTSSGENNHIYLWGDRHLVSELKSRLHATVDPVSKGTEIKITTYGRSNLINSIQITKPGPITKLVSKENCDLTGKVTEEYKDFSKYMSAKPAPKEEDNAEVDDDEWD